MPRPGSLWNRASRLAAEPRTGQQVLELLGLEVPTDVEPVLRSLLGVEFDNEVVRVAEQHVPAGDQERTLVAAVVRRQHPHLDTATLHGAGTDDRPDRLGLAFVGSRHDHVVRPGQGVGAVEHLIGHVLVEDVGDHDDPEGPLGVVAHRRIGEHVVHRRIRVQGPSGRCSGRGCARSARPGSRTIRPSPSSNDRSPRIGRDTAASGSARRVRIGHPSSRRASAFRTDGFPAVVVVVSEGDIAGRSRRRGSAP